MTLDECYQQNKGKALLIPGGGAGNEGQCVQWVDTVLHDVHGLPYVYADAINWWTDFNSFPQLVNNFNRVTDGSVRKGDFVVFNTKVGSIYGHIDVAMADGNTGNFQGADSNWNGNKTVHLEQHTNAGYVLGCLRRKGVNVPSTEEILRSALNKSEHDRVTYESAMNAAREADKIHESALDAAKADLEATKKLLESASHNDQIHESALNDARAKLDAALKELDKFKK
jgi:hypothetical protein